MTMAVLSPLRKQGDVSKVPADPTDVLLQGSSAPPTATTPHAQGSSTSPTATLACTQGSGTALPDTLAHSYTPIVHLDLLLASIKGRFRALMREGCRAGGRADEPAHSLSLSLSLSLANACNPYCKRIPPWRRITRAVIFPPLCSISRQPIWAGARSDNFTRRSRDPLGSKRRQLVCQVGACCVLTNNFPLSSRWVVSSNLFSPGRCSVLGVSSSCPSTAATTWYSSPRSAIATTTVVSSPGGGELDDVFPPWRKSSIPGLSRRLPRCRRRRRGNHGQAGGGTSSAVERVNGAGTPAGDMSGVALAPETTTSVISPQHANPKRMDDASTLAGTCWALASYLRLRCSPSPTRPRHRPSIERYHPFSTLCFLDSASIHQATPLR
jgi:hypothetical protein